MKYRKLFLILAIATLSLTACGKNADRGKAVTESEVDQNGETQVENTD